jgi:hypothetical protein
MTFIVKILLWPKVESVIVVCWTIFRSSSIQRERAPTKSERLLSQLQIGAGPIIFMMAAGFNYIEEETPPGR